MKEKVKRRFVASGHLIDSGILATILNLIVEEEADYEIVEFTVGKTNVNPSHLEIDVICRSEENLDALSRKLVQVGCYEKRVNEAVLKPSEKEGTVPDDFYSTTNHRTEVYFGGRWVPVANMRMDGVIVVTDGTAECKKVRDVLEGDAIVCSGESVRVFPPERKRETDVFGFMENTVSSERGVAIAVGGIADEMRRLRDEGKKVVVVAGPVIVHTGSGRHFAALIREGYIQGLLSGNALAVHDIESEFYGTSLGVELATGKPTHQGHKNHMRAINRIRKHGSMKAAVVAGDLQNGIMYETITADIPYCLAGSIRDDGPLPETETDMIRAQEAYARIIRGSEMVVMLSSMLHSIGTGNMLPSWVKTVCVDINPAVVTKLSDRGSSQTVGIVSDVGLFVRALAQQLIGSNEI
jgi:lysine-ketoglutarate reductase/saccharopine dehydrogenase-like protein (TIGR00300 family)